MSLPSLNPLQAPNVVCPSCGTLIAAEPVRVGKARVTEVLYTCVNEEKGCSWQTKATLNHITGEGPYAVKKEELERRRTEAETVKRYQELRDNSMSELIAMLPTLKEIALAYRQAERPNPALESDGSGAGAGAGG